MKVLIVEDEQIAAKKLEKLLVSLNRNIEIVNKTKSVKETISWLAENSVDLIFLDIQLTDGISFSIFENLNINTPVIFTTAYDQYAIKAFELNSLSYLLKPVRKRDLEKALDKYDNLKSNLTPDIQYLTDLIQNNEKAYKKRFLVQIGDKIHKIETKDISCFYAEDKAVFIQTFEGRNRSIDYSLDNLENMLNPDEFFRINRSIIVNINAISEMFAYSRSRVKLNLLPKKAKITEAIVSVQKSSEFKKWIDR